MERDYAPNWFLGESLLRYFNGQILTQNELNEIAYSSAEEKIAALTSTCVHHMSLKEDNSINNFIKNEESIKRKTDELQEHKTK